MVASTNNRYSTGSAVSRNNAHHYKISSTSACLLCLLHIEKIPLYPTLSSFLYLLCSLDRIRRISRDKHSNQRSIHDAVPGSIQHGPASSTTPRAGCHAAGSRTHAALQPPSLHISHELHASGAGQEPVQQRDCEVRDASTSTDHGQ